MIHVMSIATARPGRLPVLTRCISQDELAIRRGGPGQFRGAWISEFGALNNVYSLWEYADAGQYAQAVARLHDHAAWGSYTEQAELLLAREATLLLAPERPLARAPDDSVLYDFRIYDIRPFHALEYARRLREVLPVRERYSRNFGIWRPLAGNANRIIHLWPYDSLEHRTAVRAKVAKEPEWKAFVEQVFPLLVRQRSSLLRPIAGLALDG